MWSGVSDQRWAPELHQKQSYSLCYILYVEISLGEGTSQDTTVSNQLPTPHHHPVVESHFILGPLYLPQYMVINLQGSRFKVQGVCVPKIAEVVMCTHTCVPGDVYKIPRAGVVTIYARLL